MEIKLNLKTRLTLTEFADKYGLVLTINERTPSDVGNRWDESLRFYACFDDCEVKSGSMLTSTYGNGATHDAAIHEYIIKISEKLLVLDAFSVVKRREVQVPILIGK